MGKGAGLASAMTANTAKDLAEAAKFLIEAAAPRLLVVRVTDGPPTVPSKLNPSKLNPSELSGSRHPGCDL